MYYIIYKTTNNINGKYYIGKHQTKNLNDGYMGSGKLLKRAIFKYGLENFSKEILYVFDAEEDMNQKEKELVVVSEETYNLCEGGKGGFGYINRTVSAEQKQIHKARNIFHNKLKTDLEFREAYLKSRIGKKIPTISEALLKRYKEYGSHWTGKTHSDETKMKISKAAKTRCGSKNSQFGTCWITNGNENKKIKKETLDDWLSNDYRRGRMKEISTPRVWDPSRTKWRNT